MSKTKESKFNQWRITYQNQTECYDSQQSALIAADRIISSCESGIWSEKSHLYLSYEKGDNVDSDLLNSHYSTNVLIPTGFDGMFRIDVFAKNKEDWIFKYGSDLLQQSILAGYECNEGYLAERVAHDYPGFTVNDRQYRKVDTPTQSCLYACFGYPNAYCSSNHQKNYITIDNFLGKYQLIKLISDPDEMNIISSTGGAIVNNLFKNILLRKYHDLSDLQMIVLSSSVFTFLSIILYAVGLIILP
jgi:hypothetical protein